MVWGMFLTPMLKTVLIGGNTMCITAALTRRVPMPQRLQASKPAVCSLHLSAPPPPPQRLRLHHSLMISILWRVRVMGRKWFTMLRPLRCRKMIWKWDRVHRVRMKLLVLFVVMHQSRTTFCLAFRFCDFIVFFAVTIKARSNFV